MKPIKVLALMVEVYYFVKIINKNRFLSEMCVMQ